MSLEVQRQLPFGLEVNSISLNSLSRTWEPKTRRKSGANFLPGHDRGRILVDVAAILADGGKAIAGIAGLRHQSQVLGPVAAPPTVWRTLKQDSPTLKQAGVAPLVLMTGVAVGLTVVAMWWFDRRDIPQ